MKTVPVTCIPYSSHSEDFGDLQVNINDLVKSSSSLCGFNNCEGLWTIETVLKTHILIEVSNIPEDKFFYQDPKKVEENLLDVPEAVFGDVVCSLESIPTRITIMNELFILRIYWKQICCKNRYRALCSSCTKK
ncbi:hypothetical protein ACI65C_006987 [Semiaphis heraclei]